MPSRLTRRLVPVVLVIALGTGAEPARISTDPTPTAAEVDAPVKTGKERLGSKASDEQRVNNCKVPPELRGPKPRPDTCPGETDPTPIN